MSSSPRRASRRALVTLVAAGGLVLVPALPASAHVTVSSPDAAPGGFGKLVFRVPTESGTASTTRLQVVLPTRTPFASVSTKPLPGWTVTTRERKLPHPVEDDGFTLTKAVGVVTWTADAGRGVRPGQFEEFELSVGPFPKSASSVSMQAVQTYSDGSVVRWDQPTRSGQPEPEHPAPTLQLSAGTTSGPEHSEETTTAATPPSASAPTATGTTDDLARWLGGIGIAVGAAGVATAVLGRRRRA
jgi:uncharacterized protein YcnI